MVLRVHQLQQMAILAKMTPSGLKGPFQPYYWTLHLFLNEVGGIWPDHLLRKKTAPIL